MRCRVNRRKTTPKSRHSKTKLGKRALRRASAMRLLTPQSRVMKMASRLGMTMPKRLGVAMPKRLAIIIKLSGEVEKIFS